MDRQPECEDANTVRSPLTRPIWILSFVSLFADVASEMLYPIMPMYLASIGFNAALIGFLEGAAEAVAGLSKGLFGSLSDRLGRRMPFVRIGYFLSAVSKPMMAVLSVPVWVFSARTVDRLGKGIRTASRDALLARLAPEGRRGEVFGFHRRMDTIGAAIGPVAALTFLYYLPGEYRFLFFAAAAPGFMSVILTFFVSDKGAAPAAVSPACRTAPPEIAAVAAPPPDKFSWNYFRTAPAGYRRVVTALFIFAMVNSSDIFLLMSAKKSGLTDVQVVGYYIFYNFVFALFAHPLGRLADKIGYCRTFAGGLVLFCVTYAGMGFFPGSALLIFLFFCYGVYAGATEGVSRAWLSQLVPDEQRGRALGWYSTAQSLATLTASSAAGLLWIYVSPSAPFVLAAAGAGLVSLYLFFNADSFRSGNQTI